MSHRAKIKAPIEELSFEQAFEEMEQIVRQLEEGQLSLDDSLALFERGQALSARCQQLLETARERPGFSVLMGPEELLAASVLMGGQGGVCGGANLLPALYCELYEAALTGDLRIVQRLQHRVMRLSRKLYEVGEAPTSYLTGLKMSLELVGLCSGRLCEPLYQMPPGRQQRLVQHLRDLGLQPAANAN